MTKEDFLERMTYMNAKGKRTVVRNLIGFYRRTEEGRELTDYDKRLLLPGIDHIVQRHVQEFVEGPVHCKSYE